MINLDELRSTTSDGTLPTHAWPGGYPLVYYSHEQLVLCPKCADKADTSDPVECGAIHWEGSPLVCEDCGTVIESAYGEPDAVRR